MPTAELIAKEDIPKYKLARASVDHSHDLHDKLVNAARLGNEFKGKAVITFQTIEGPKRVETTVWTVTEEALQIKNGIVLPLNALLDIDY